MEINSEDAQKDGFQYERELMRALKSLDLSMAPETCT